MNSKFSPEELRSRHSAGYWRYAVSQWQTALLPALLLIAKMISDPERRQSALEMIVIAGALTFVALFLLWLYWLDLEYKVGQLEKEPPAPFLTEPGSKVNTLESEQPLV